MMGSVWRCQRQARQGRWPSLSVNKAPIKSDRGQRVRISRHRSRKSWDLHLAKSPRSKDLGPQDPGLATTGAQWAHKTDFVWIDFTISTFCPPLKIIKYLGEKFDYISHDEKKNPRGADLERMERPFSFHLGLEGKYLLELAFTVPCLCCSTFSSVDGKASWELKVWNFDILETRVMLL